MSYQIARPRAVHVRYKPGAVLRRLSHILFKRTLVACIAALGLVVGTRTQTQPGAITSHDVDNTGSLGAIDAYCSFHVFGTSDRKDLRADLNATLTRTIPNTNIPIFLSRALEAH